MSNQDNKIDSLTILSPLDMYRNRDQNINHIKKYLVLSQHIYGDPSFLTLVNRYVSNSTKKILDSLSDETIRNIMFLLEDFQQKWRDIKKNDFSLHDKKIYMIVESKKTSRNNLESITLQKLSEYIDNIDERRHRLNDYYIVCADSYEDFKRLPSRFTKTTFSETIYRGLLVYKIN